MQQSLLSSILTCQQNPLKGNASQVIPLPPYEVRTFTPWKYGVLRCTHPPSHQRQPTGAGGSGGREQQLTNRLQVQSLMLASTDEPRGPAGRPVHTHPTCDHPSRSHLSAKDVNTHTHIRYSPLPLLQHPDPASRRNASPTPPLRRARPPF